MQAINGWKQISEKVWHGNGNNEIKIKKLKRGIAIEVYTEEYGHESGKESTMDEALKTVEWFMNRRPQKIDFLEM